MKNYLNYLFGMLFTLGCIGCGTSSYDPLEPDAPFTSGLKDSDDNISGSLGSEGDRKPSPTKEWFHSYKGSQEESHGHYILACTDGGYLQVGETGKVLKNNSSAKILVVKVDSKGKLQWKKELGEPGKNLGNSAIEVSDGYIVVGALNLESALIKLDKITGEMIFSKTYEKSGANAIEHITPLSNGFALVGYTDAEDGESTFYTYGKGLLFMVDNEGDEVVGLPMTDLQQYMSHGYRVFEHDGDLLVGGLTQDAEDFAVAKFDSDTLIAVWAHEYGHSEPDHLFAMDIDHSGEIYVSGHSLSNTLNWDTLTMKIGQDGRQLWEHVRGNPRGYDPNYIHDEAWGIKVTSDGGAVVAVGTGDEYEHYSACTLSETHCSDIWQVYVIKFSPFGTVEWEATFGDPRGGDWAGEGIALSEDGGAVVAVDDGSFGFLKLSPF